MNVVSAFPAKRLLNPYTFLFWFVGPNDPPKHKRKTQSKLLTFTWFWHVKPQIPRSFNMKPETFPDLLERFTALWWMWVGVWETMIPDELFVTACSVGDIQGPTVWDIKFHHATLEGTSALPCPDPHPHPLPSHLLDILTFPLLI